MFQRQRSVTLRRLPTKRFQTVLAEAVVDDIYSAFTRIAAVSSDLRISLRLNLLRLCGGWWCRLLLESLPPRFLTPDSLVEHGGMVGNDHQSSIMSRDIWEMNNKRNCRSWSEVSGRGLKVKRDFNQNLRKPSDFQEEAEAGTNTDSCCSQAMVNFCKNTSGSRDLSNTKLDYIMHRQPISSPIQHSSHTCQRSCCRFPGV